jgi:hypothetical protein
MHRGPLLSVSRRTKCCGRTAEVRRCRVFHRSFTDPERCTHVHLGAPDDRAHIAPCGALLRAAPAQVLGRSMVSRRISLRSVFG